MWIFSISLNKMKVEAFLVFSVQPAPADCTMSYNNLHKLTKLCLKKQNLTKLEVMFFLFKTTIAF